MSVHPRECKFAIFYNFRVAPPRFNPAKVKRAAVFATALMNVRAPVINWMNRRIYLRRGSAGVTTESLITETIRTLRSGEVRTMGKFRPAGKYRWNRGTVASGGDEKKNLPHSNPLSNENSRASCTRRESLYRELFAACISRIRIIDGYYQFQLFVRNR